MITDGEPTAHIDPNGEVFFSYPPVPETVEATLREVARCTREGIRINTFMLDANSYLKAFVEKLTQMNRGRAFFTTPETLGDYVLVDFIEQKKAMRAGRRGASDRFCVAALRCASIGSCSLRSTMPASARRRRTAPPLEAARRDSGGVTRRDRRSEFAGGWDRRARRRRGLPLARLRRNETQ